MSLAFAGLTLPELARVGPQAFVRTSVSTTSSWSLRSSLSGTQSFRAQSNSAAFAARLLPQPPRYSIGCTAPVLAGTETIEGSGDLAKALKALASMSHQHPLSKHERHLLAQAFQQQFESQQAHWHRLQAEEEYALAVQNPALAQAAAEHRARQETQLKRLCWEVLELLEAQLIPSACVTEAAVFYLSLKAEYLRHLNDLRELEARRDAVLDAEVFCYEI